MHAHTVENFVFAPLETMLIPFFVNKVGTVVLRGDPLIRTRLLTRTPKSTHAQICIRPHTHTRTGRKADTHTMSTHTYLPIQL